MKKLLAVSLLFFSCCALAAEKQLVLDPASTVVTFTLPDPLHKVEGHFKLKKGDIRFDDEAGTVSGLIVIDAQSGESGSKGRDQRMHKNILESQKFPEISFRPEKLEGKLAGSGDSEVRLVGVFSIHGADHAVSLPAKVHREGDQVTAVIAFPVPYVKWGMKNPSVLIMRVGDTVQIEIQAAGRVH